MTQKIEKLTILDFDGTVLDSTGVWSNVYQSYCKRHNLTISEQIRLNQSNSPFTEWIETIKATHKITQPSKSLIVALNEIAKEVYNKILPKAGFVDFVQVRHTSKSKTIIVSREEPDLIKSYLNNYRISEVSEVLQDSNQKRTRANFYTDISKMYGCKTKNITLIDDSLSHCTIAKQAGVFVIGINDNHSVSRNNQMRLICELYVNDFTPLLKL
jgi:beta-phosphoglucomutase-like phosphatase (HAD superfamily)